MEAVKNIFQFALDVSFVVFPTLGYIHQYIKIYRLKIQKVFQNLFHLF